MHLFTVYLDSCTSHIAFSFSAGPTAAPAAAPSPSPKPSNPAVLVLNVQINQITARSITQYAWAVRHSSAADKSSVKFSDKAVLSQTIEVSLTLISRLKAHVKLIHEASLCTARMLTKAA
jgi:hypothetical protein